MNPLNPEISSRLSSLIEHSKRIAIVCHMTPDGDALGSSLCLMHALSAMGKRAMVITPDAPPKTLSFLPGFNDITVASYHPERARLSFLHADLIFCLDFNDLKRIDRTAPMVEQASAPIVVIDHHLNPVLTPEVLISHPEESSTCVLLYQVLQQLGLTRFVNTDAATCCCAGMMTDTGNFSYNANSPALYRIVAELLEKGVDKNQLVDRLFNTNTLSRLRIMGFCQYARMHVMPEHHCAVITLSLDEAREFGYTKGDTEGLVNIPLSIPGIIYSIYLRQDEENYVKVSMRSKGSFSVKHLCEKHFNGGGHLNAAGGEIYAPIDRAFTRILDILPECDQMLSSTSSI
ncbi:MAG: DHH family phosphoesterase [Firmicutes bacterium]|nr:DHH family phosphoesterase [Bacillota bacterium]MCM1402051.1 DHH family phosphoesterase [Bacteroides sp.]MCM1477758.1 DHH family phosphoesterase [Bacteroides sp.]